MKPTLATSGKSAAAGDDDQARIDLRNAELVHQLAAYMDRNGLLNNTRDRGILGKRLSYADGTAVYRYLAGKPEGDLAKFEKRLAAFLDNELRLGGGGELVDDPSSFILHSMFAFLDQVRKCGDIGIAHAPAGTGKSCAVKLYTAQHKKTTVSIHLWKWTGGKSALVTELVKSTGLSVTKNQCAEPLLARWFKDHGAMLILDNAQRMTPSARDWLRDFLDFTGIPIALVGNPIIERQLARVDQHKRVVGLRRDVSLDLYDAESKHNSAKTTVKHLLKLHLPEGEHDAAVTSKALKLLTQEQSGACGAVRMHCKLARLMLQGGKVTTPAKAFELASTQLITA
jgi:DNA transposition AAA+ family ATPase